MIKRKYLEQLKKIVNKYPAKYFIFGSSVGSGLFNDIDIGVIGANERSIVRLSEDLNGSTFPYKVDLVNIDIVDKNFKKKVLDKDIIWLN
jgi:hypothetical protein